MHLATTKSVVSMQYAFGIGRQREGDAHVRTAVQHFLPAINADDNAYPLHFLRLWLDLLDATTHCSGAADSAFMSAIEGQLGNVQVIQVCPTAAQLNLAAQILQSPNLRKVVYSAGNLELRAKVRDLVPVDFVAYYCDL
jgi:hypothetical protein